MRLQPLVSEAAARLRTAGIERPFWEARLLLAWAAEARMEDVIGERVAVSETLQTRFWELVARRGGREPMAYIAGRKEFWSLPFAVGPGVLVPRPETETLVE